jgi:hypothetical protein
MGHVASPMFKLPSSRRSKPPSHDGSHGCAQNDVDLIGAFIAQVSKPLPLAVAQKPPIRHRAKVRLPATADGLPHRSARVAAQGRSRVSNPETQAQNVLMKKWDITSVARSLDADALKDYNTIYRSRWAHLTAGRSGPFSLPMTWRLWSSRRTSSPELSLFQGSHCTVFNE